jgi:3-phosphoshikimate 1-carboxyvinyltransferase
MTAAAKAAVPFLDLAPAARAQGTVRLPGSKSISNRVLLLAAVAEGTTEILGLLRADDTDRMLDALSRLGVVLERAADRVSVVGCNGALPVKDAELFLGNAGTAFRPLTAVLALGTGQGPGQGPGQGHGHYRLSGAPRMHQRPIGDLVDALRTLGADLRYLGEPGFPPLDIFPAAIRAGGTVKVRGDVSSQFLTALLMALPLAGGGASIDVDGELISKPYVAITLELMRKFGVMVVVEDWRRFHIAPGQSYRAPGTFHVEGDASSASYFLAAGAIGGGPVRVEGVGDASIQGDVGFAGALFAMGARVASGGNWIEVSAPAGRRLQAYDGDCNQIPDAAMTLAVLALFAEGTTRLRNIASWRVKETDRIAAMATELRKLGATVDEGPDFLNVTPPDGHRLTPNASIDTYDDHRIAMCFSLAALGGVTVRINDPGCVAKTFPDYFDRLASIFRPGEAV